VVKDDNNCQFRDTVYINPAVQLNVDTAVTDVSCFGGNDGLINMLALDGTGPYSYSIYDGLFPQDNGYFPDLLAGTYTVLVTDALGGKFRNMVTVNEPAAITPIASVTDANCQAMLTGFTDLGAIDITVAGGTGPFTFEWRNSGGSLIAATEDLTGISADDYTVTITDNNTCKGSATFTVNFDPAKAVTLSAIDDLQACYKEEVVLIANATNESGYAWEILPTLELISDQQTLTVYPDSSLSYRAVAYNTFNCAAYDTFAIGLKPFMGISISNDTMIMLGDVPENIPVDVRYPDNIAGATYIWTPSTNLDDPGLLNPLFTPTDKAQSYYEYILLATSSLSCTESDTARIQVLWDLTVPSGFTPNNDGINDLWVIEAAYAVPVSVEVFNRWGEHVFIAKQYDNTWDGTRNDKPLPIGTYYFVITIEAGSGKKTITGPITIVR
jgi:gliding motility-associated-like protein